MWYIIVFVAGLAIGHFGPVVIYRRMAYWTELYLVPELRKLQAWWTEEKQKARSARDSKIPEAPEPEQPPETPLVLEEEKQE